MLERLFGAGSGAGPVVTAMLNARALPLDRGDLYEDPLDERLRRQSLGKVLRAGTMMQPSGEIDHCDIDMELVDLSDETLASVTGIADEIGVPKGSVLRFGEAGTRIPIGAHEGLALYLSASVLSRATNAADRDVNALIVALERALGPHGHYVSHWQGVEETALYLYGPSFAQMRAAVAPIIAECSLCRRARLVQIA